MSELATRLEAAFNRTLACHVQDSTGKESGPMRSFGVETRNLHKKHKPKRKVSELDEIEAKRDQASRAQRAFRQRKEDTIASLNLRIRSLDKTVEDLNSCFLNLTDEVVASYWLQHDPTVTKAVQKSIERFLFIVRESDIHQRDNEDIIAYQNSTSATNKPPAMEKNDYASHQSSHRDPIAVAMEPMPTASLWRGENQWSLFRNIPGEIMPSRTDEVNFMSRLPMQGPRISIMATFAQRLHIEAIWCGLRLVHAADSYSQQFFQVFNQVPDFNTRERLKSILNNIFDVQGSPLLAAPPESHVNILCAGGLPSPWLNASDVARYFRIIGMDFDGSQGIVTFKDYPGTLKRRLLKEQGLGTTGHSSVDDDGTLELDYRYQSPGVAAHHNNPISSHSATTHGLSGFWMSTNDASYTDRDHGQSYICIDVSRLIQEIILGTRCVQSYPAFNRDFLDHALARAAVKTRCLKESR
ncbi:hypothetical protein LTR84_006700 [Exophiala bonariae]|uniref:BZIP domain-containing protein n=1 Tax=Exophiala bonariae TaxID=1690606 RepID=A0AAV9N3Y2_9EURO|nr:hypothetical protein LTR84_006700 [Exophiala bonariae]